MRKLDLRELVVSSFETGPSVDLDVTHPTDPTPATFCRICPPYEEQPATGGSAQEL
jgi:hypothetical protein